MALDHDGSACDGRPSAMEVRHAHRVLIIGGGGTGGALAHDLALRGLRVVLVERHGLASGTTGRHHGLLHSGARYAVNDPESAAECVRENRILRRIAPGSFEENDGLFVALTEEDLAFREPFLAACEAAGIPVRWLAAEEARRHEPGLNPGLLGAARVPDGTMDALRLPLRFFATAIANGAEVRPWSEVVGMTGSPRCVTGVRVRDRATGRLADVGADVVVNAGGPWSGAIGRLAGVDVPVRPSPGVLVAVRGRHANMVVSRLHPSSDGDIVVPQRGLSIIGTSSWLADDPDDLSVPEDHVRLMRHEGARLLPSLRLAEVRAAWSAARPLIGDRGAGSGRELSRTFRCFDHARDDGVEGLVTITGGKATTLRGMAELAADVIVAKLGLEAPCRTAETVLLPHTAIGRVPEAA
jgi:glycerol-3-phosphate dehydrogenase